MQANSNQYVVRAIPIDDHIIEQSAKHAIGLIASYRCAYEFIENEWTIRGVGYSSTELDAIRKFLELKDQEKHHAAIVHYNEHCGGKIKIIIEHYKLPQFSINENCRGVNLREKVKV